MSADSPLHRFRWEAVGRRVRGLWHAALWTMLAVGASRSLAAAPAPPPAITQVQAVASNAEHFPAGAVTATIRLPDDWAHSRPGYSGGVWYRATFDKADVAGRGDVPAALFLRVCDNLHVDLNGQRVRGADWSAEPNARSCHQPQLVSLPTALLRDGPNQLDVQVNGVSADRVAARDDAAGVSVWQLGSHDVLADIAAQRRFWNVGAVELAGMALLTMGCVLLGLGWLHQRDAQLLYFGGFCIGWALLGAGVWLQATPADIGWSDRLLTFAVAPVGALAVQFLLVHAGLPSQRVAWALIAQCIVLPGSLWLAGADHLAAASLFWDAVLAIEVLAAALLCLRVLATRRPGERWPMTLLFFAIATLLIVDAVLGRAPADRPPVSLLYLVLPVLLLVIGAHLLRLFAGALRNAEAGRQSLEARVQQITDEIERNFAQLAELRVEQVTDKERKRIAADLHDDLGAKLLTIVHTSESERISTLAREALEEMRLSVRGLTSKPVRLVDALADWRAEIVSRLGQANIETDWRGPPEDGEQVLPARSYVQTTRILREAVSNIIKHSGATHCKVRVLVGEQDFAVTVQDNGRGIPLEVDGRLDRGHGMSSMKHRAKQLRGQCLVESGPGYGTVIRVTLPL